MLVVRTGVEALCFEARPEVGLWQHTSTSVNMSSLL